MTGVCDINTLSSYIRPEWAMAAAEFSRPFLVPLFPSQRASPTPQRGPAVMAGRPRMPGSTNKNTTWKETPPLLPFYLNPCSSGVPLSSSFLLFLSTRGGIVTICPTFVLRRKDRAAFVALVEEQGYLGGSRVFPPAAFPQNYDRFCWSAATENGYMRSLPPMLRQRRSR